MGKRIFFYFILLVSSVIISSFYEPATRTASYTSPPLPYTDKFLIGVMNSYDFMGVYDQGGFNTTHKYITGEQGQFQNNPNRWSPKLDIAGIDESLFEDISPGNIYSVINNMYQNHNQSRFIWQRPKIEWLCFGQSSIYKAFQDDPNFWFYSFNTRSGQQYADNQYNGGKDVLYCSQPNMGPGARIVLSRLKSNTEQSRRISSGAGNEWTGDSDCEWFVKPRIRADRNFIINPNNADVEICKLYVIMNDGITQKTITPTTIKARDFQKNYDPINLYNGDYIEEFYFDGAASSPRGLRFTGDLVADTDLPTWWFCARGENAETADINHADIQIEWLDNCEMWLDYVKVENDIADELFKGIRDPWIIAEANAVNQSPYVYNFYTELTEFNNTPCMAYVNHKLDSITDGKINYMSDLLTHYTQHMPWNRKGEIDQPQKLKEMFFDKTGMRQIYLGDPYPITALHDTRCYNFGPQVQYSRLPNTLGASTNSGEEYGTRVVPNDYDAWLQNQLDTTCDFFLSTGYYSEAGQHPLVYKGVFSYLLKRGNAVSKLCDIPLIMMLQAHQWVSEGELDREPTIEEQKLMANLSVSYGAKGVIYWQMPTFGNPSSCFHCRGIAESFTQPRSTNLYSQPKWDSLKRDIARLKTWGPILMSFDNKETNSYIYRIEKNVCLNETYFSDVKTFIAEQLKSEIPSENPEPDSMRYIQAAVFKNMNEPDAEYFMIVNRRCSPVSETSDGGRRFISVRFDITGTNKWRITELISNTVINVNSSLGHYANLGWFAPGEGRLYKMIPAQN